MACLSDAVGAVFFGDVFDPNHPCRDRKTVACDLMQNEMPTMQAMQWTLERMKKQKTTVQGDGTGRDTFLRPTSILLLNDNGHSYTKQKGRNNNHKEFAESMHSSGNRLKNVFVIQLST